MGQIIGSAAKPKRCNIQSLSSLGTPAAGEYILVSSDNSMNAAGQGNFDLYIEGDGTKAATALELRRIDKDLYSLLLKSSYYSEINLPDIYESITKKYIAGVNGWGSFNHYFINVYEVSEGETWHVFNDGTYAPSAARRWAVYSATQYEAVKSTGTGPALMTGANCSTVYSDTIAIPTGAKYLVVTNYSYTTSVYTPNVLRQYNSPVNTIVPLVDRSTCVEVNSDGTELYIASIIGSVEYVYRFKKCLANNLFTIDRVGYRASLGRKTADTMNISTFTGITTLMYSSSDNIGPLSLYGGTSKWVGGNHLYPSNTASTTYKTARTSDFSIYADGVIVGNGEKKLCREVVVKVHNILYNPFIEPTEGDEYLSTPVADQYEIYSIKEDTIEVSINVQFVAGTTINITFSGYYGMQVMGYGNNPEYLTPNGQFTDWASGSASCLKSSYPDLHRFIIRRDTGYISAFLYDNKMGDHRYCGTGAAVFSFSNGKGYHQIVGGSPTGFGSVAGKRVTWSGAYTFASQVITDDTNLLVYRGVVNGKDALYIATKGAYSGKVSLPESYYMRKFSIIEQADVTTENEFCDIDGIYIEATAASTLVIALD